ncbi:unnamed protein product [Paramecium sonneborni]|uniref:Transmembrane protein n=1 Tax=Paramecium sonneborni TaxID=65129 RepID=A0A8S1QR18_9CILI|nr:unnamed protein product [Paramecium sonneborni]
MSHKSTQNSNYPFYQYCLGGPQQNFLKCTNCIILGVIIILLLFILIQQLHRRYQTGTKKLSKKCIILYMIMINFLSNHDNKFKYYLQSPSSLAINT